MHRFRAMTLIELMVVILIVGVLVALTIPGIGMSRITARQTSCGNNQRQIVLAMLVYANDSEGRWPCRLSDSAGRLVPVGTASKSTSIGTFEFLAGRIGMDLPSKLFGCPQERAYRPTTVARTDLDATPGDVSAWCVAAASSAFANPGYVYDWSVPANAHPLRVVIADRGRGPFAHGKLVMAAFGDGHVGVLKSATPSGRGTTPNLDDATGAPGALNPDAPGDDVYTGTGDGDDAMTPGEGSATRAWVR